jgi:hypothetical protein
LNFRDFYAVLLQFEKRIRMNMQKINLEFRIMGRITEGAELLCCSPPFSFSY